MAEGFFKSRAHLFNQLATTLGRRPTGEGSADGPLAVTLAPMSDLPPTVAALPALEKFHDEAAEPNTGVRPAVDTGGPTSSGAAQRPTTPAPGATSASEGVQQTPRVSGFQQITVRSVRAPNDAVRAANVEFEDRVGDRVELPLAVLINQRDRALRDLAELHGHAEQALQESTADHDRLVALLMLENSQRVAVLEAKLQAEYERAGRASFTRDGADGRDSTSSQGDQDLADAQRELIELRLEVEETRAAAARLQSERDEAIRAIDSVRAELASEIDSAREEAVELQARVDATERALTDARDQARDEAAGLNEQLVELRRRLEETTV